MKSRLPPKLFALNLLRWLREYIVSWGLLSFIYSLTVTLILQSILEQALKKELEFKSLWFTTCATLLLPGLFEALKLPPLSFRKGLLTFMPPGVFGENLWQRWGGAITKLYLRHELRRGATWLVIVLVVLIASLLPDNKKALWVLIAQLPIQRALYSVHRWRGLALAFHPKQGAEQLMRAIWASQFLQIFIAWIALVITRSIPDPWMYGCAALGAVISAGSVAMEGDSGRPWMVNFIALAAGTLGGYLCLATPWALPFVIYFGGRMAVAIENRLLSVEHLDEDTLIP